MLLCNNGGPLDFLLYNAGNKGDLVVLLAPWLNTLRSSLREFNGARRISQIARVFVVPLNPGFRIAKAHEPLSRVSNGDRNNGHLGLESFSFRHGVRRQEITI